MNDKTIKNGLGLEALRDYISPTMMTYPMESFEIRYNSGLLVTPAEYRSDYGNQTNVATFNVAGAGTNWKTRIYIPAGIYMINLLARMNGIALTGQFNLYIDGVQVGNTLDYNGNQDNWSMVTQCFTTAYATNTSGWKQVEIRDVWTGTTHYPYLSQIAFIRKS